MATSDSNSRSTRGASRMALMLVGALALAGLAYAIARVDILRARIATLRETTRILQDSNQRLQTQLQTLQAGIGADHDQQQQLQEDFNRLAQELGARTDLAPVQRQWARIEALYLLRLAQHQLQLAHDVDSAIPSLSAALNTLAADAALTDMRTQLEQALQQLRSLPLAERLRSEQVLQQATNELLALPLRPDNKAVTDPGTPRAWTVIKRSLGSLVSIRPKDAALTLTLNADTQALGRAHAHALLTDALLALRAHDQARYQAALQQARAEFNAVLDTGNAKVQLQLRILQQLSELNIALQLPDLSASIQRLAALTPDAANQGAGATP